MLDICESVSPKIRALHAAKYIFELIASTALVVYDWSLMVAILLELFEYCGNLR